MKKGLLVFVTCTLLFFFYTYYQYQKSNNSFEKLELMLIGKIDSLQKQFIVPHSGIIKERLEFLFQSKSQITCINTKLLDAHNRKKHDALAIMISKEIEEIKSWPDNMDFYVFNSEYKNANDKNALLRKLKDFYGPAKRLFRIENKTKLDQLISKQIFLLKQLGKDYDTSSNPQLLNQVRLELKDFIAFLKSKRISAN